MSQVFKRAAIILMLAGIIPMVSSCISKTSLSSQYKILTDKPDGLSLTRNVLLVADNQLNYLYGDPIWLRSGLSDKLARVAIRPVQQDLFGQDILRWVLEIYGSQYPVIHLGDAANMACVGEFESFLEIMEIAGKPWVMAPGNHDAYLFGNLHKVEGDWTAVCKGAGGPMTKDKLVQRYLQYLYEHFDRFHADYEGGLPLKDSWRDSEGSDNFIKSIAWEIDEENPWRSYIVQEINLGLKNSTQPVSAILLDTTQYSNAPALIPSPVRPNAGINGDIQANQIEIVRRWAADDPSGRKITLIMGHHPWDRLIKKSRDAIEAMILKYRVPVYVSAHTHYGEYIARGGREGSEGWLELNVGSIVDWPIEFRTFSIHLNRNDPEQLVLRTKLFRIPKSWETGVLSPPVAPKSIESWEVKPEEKGYYLSYMDITTPNPKKTQIELMNALLYTYKRLLTYLPSADDNQFWPACCAGDDDIVQEIDNALSNDAVEQKISILKELNNFEHMRIPENKLARRDYRLWQAVWASKYDLLERRQPIPSDSYISFPRR